LEFGAGLSSQNQKQTESVPAVNRHQKIKISF